MYTKIRKKRIGGKCPVCLDVPWDCRDSTPRVELISFSEALTEIDPVKKVLSLLENRQQSPRDE